MASIAARTRLAPLACVLAAALIASHATPADAAGELDPSFGTNGTVVTPVVRPPSGQIDAAALALTIQSDGALVAGGSASRDAVIARYTTDGQLDAAFGGTGVVILPFGGGAGGFEDVVEQSDGKLVAAGNAADDGGDREGLLARYDADGTLDSGFGDAGVARLPLGSAGGVFLGVVEQADDALVTAGYDVGVVTHAILVRHHADGTLDTGFGSGGVVKPPLGDSAFMGLTQQTDGKLVAAGYAFVGGVYRFLAARFDADGVPDADFGSGGIAIASVGFRHAFGVAVAVAPDGGIVVAGVVGQSPSPQDVAVVRFLSDGQLDASFGTNGVVTTTVGTYASGQGVLVQPDGKTVVVGAGQSGTLAVFLVARYLANGTLDPDFGSGGVVTTDIGTGQDYAFAGVRQPDAKIVAAGLATGTHLGSIALARYYGEGSPPSTTSSPTTTSTSSTADTSTLTTTTGTTSPIPSTTSTMALTTTTHTTTTTTSSTHASSTSSSTSTTSSTTTSTSTTIPGCSCANPCEVCGAQGCQVPEAAGCAPALPRRASLMLKDDPSPTRERLTWKWKGANAVAVADFGDPTSTSGYALCVLEHEAGARLVASIPPGGDCGGRPCWKTANGGFRYVDATATQAGIRSIQLKAGDVGRAKAIVKGKGAALGMPALGLATPVSARLVRVGTPLCWDATFSAPSRNDAALFKSKSD